MAAPALFVLLDLLSGARDDAQPSERWERLATVSELADAGVLYDERWGVFLVDAPQGPLALFALSPHNPTGRERVLFCRSSGWFEEPRHGEKFDRLGAYAAGPAPRGLDRFDVRVTGRSIEVDVATVYLGVSREESRPEPAAGEGCTGGEGPPGFFATASEEVAAGVN